MPSTATAADGRHSRSTVTRERLLHTGARLFAERGFDAPSTREIATAAKVNQAAITYHFGSKHGLYIAVADAIAARGRDAMRLHIPLGKNADRPLSATDALKALDTLLRAMLHGLVALAGDGSAAQFIVGEQSNPGPAFERLYAGYLSPLHSRITALVAMATRRKRTDTDPILQTHAIVGMVLAFVVAKETALRRAGWKTYTPAHLDRISSIVIDMAKRSLRTNATAQRTTARKTPSGTRTPRVPG